MKKNEHDFLEQLTTDGPRKPRRQRKKKRTRAQEEKRAKLLQHILNKWVCVKQSDGDDDSYLFLMHRTSDEHSTSKIEQVILSGDDLYDGVYLITDYDIDMVYDSKAKREIIEFRPKKFDVKAGRFAEDVITESFDQLKMHLVDAKYLTEEEFSLYCQSTRKPPGIAEMLLEYDGSTDDKS